MKRWLTPIATVAVALGFAAGASPAVAAPARPAPVELSFDMTCPTFDPQDPIFIIKAQASGKIGIIELPGDRTKVTGPNLRVTLTGPAPTLKTVTYVITGVTHITTLPDGGQDVTATGKNLITVPDANGHPEGVFLTTGTVSWTLNADGSERKLFSGSGQVVDVCQLLAP
ncbi:MULTISPECIES: hypothetical protein [unclassified Salinibacterium]|uniref:hypothetical protein n=1 Tax=unclassified Salinibacterium TaxID=2632331 RepID=UPI0014234037|nr:MULTISPECIES: hypothetical protein [unclassified Salinibacterium]